MHLKRRTLGRQGLSRASSRFLLILTLLCGVLIGLGLGAAGADQEPPGEGGAAAVGADSPVTPREGSQPAGVDPSSRQSSGWFGEMLPGYFSTVRFMDIGLWQWMALIILVVAASIVAYIVTSLLVRVVHTLVARTRTTWDDTLLNIAAGPLRLVLTVLTFYLGTYLLGLSAGAQGAVSVICKLLAVVSITWLALRLMDIVASITEQRLRRRDAAAAGTLVPMGRRITKIFVVVIAFMSLLQNLGFNITGIVAGLGVGGLAIALAAQKTVENFFGGMVVIADRPVKVGDFCRVGEHIGTVEDIGLRSTRIRTLDRTLLAIPNAEFSTCRIENFAARDRIRLYTVLQIGYDTTPDQMRYLLVEIRKMLYAHPKTLPDPCRIRFINFGAYSLDMEIFVYIATANWGEFMAIREDIFLRIMDIVEGSGAYFAYPSQTLYLARDAGRDLDKSKAAEDTVSEWRERGELLLPDFPPETVREIDDSLEYPPVGSINRG